MDITTLPPAQLPAILTPEIAALLVRCAPKTIEERLRDGDLPGDKLGEGWILPTEAFLHVLNENCMESMLKRRKRPAPAATAANDAGKNVRRLPRLPS